MGPLSELRAGSHVIETLAQGDEYGSRCIV
jgi:hypothetical protein